MRYVKVSPGQATLTEGPAAALRPGAARVRVLACGVCGTDVHLLRGMRLPAGASYPVRPGHEVAGTIVEFADGDCAGLALGDLVVLHPLDPCGVCGPCRGGQDQLCAEARVLGIHEPGGLAEEVVWPAARMVRAAGLDHSSAAVLADAGATAYRAVRAAHLRPAASVCVLGAGGVGTQVLKIIRALHPDATLAAVVGRPSSAQRLGGLGLRVEVGLAGAARRLVDELGEFDAVIEFSGQVAAPGRAPGAWLGPRWSARSRAGRSRSDPRARDRRGVQLRDRRPPGRDRDVPVGTAGPARCRVAPAAAARGRRSTRGRGSRRARPRTDGCGDDMSLHRGPTGLCFPAYYAYSWHYQAARPEGMQVG